MSTPGQDPTTTRPPTEGGWFRYGPELPERPGLPAEPGRQAGGDLDPGLAIWQPIPSFRTTELPAAEFQTAELQSGEFQTGGLGPPWAAPAPVGSFSAPARHRTSVVRSRLPLVPVTYAQLLRGPTRAWWRPILSFLLLVGVVLVLSPVPILIAIAYGLLSGETAIEGLDLWFDQFIAFDGPMAPSSFLYLFLALIVLIPAAMLSTWVVHRIRPGFLSSVAGRLRWRWLLRCLMVLAPLWVLYLGISTIIETPQSSRPEQWLVLLVMAVLLTPGQAAAEEYVFRGWILQNIGACFSRPLLSWVISGIVAAAAFAVAHGSPDPWILADLVLFSVTATFMTWRTGGLEAAIVMHTVNNVGILAVTAVIGGLDEAFIGEETQGSPAMFATSVVLHLVALALVWWQARRTGIDRFYRPVSPAQ